MIGVAGPTCSGKTTLEKGLVKSLGDTVSVMPFEDMSIAVDDPGDIGLGSWEHPDCYRWHDYRRHLRELKQGHATRVEANFWESQNEGIYERLVLPRPLVVSVGFLALHDEIAREEFDLKLYLEIPEDEIIERRAKRHQLYAPDIDPMPYIIDHVLPANRQFVVPQREYADAVIDGLQLPDQVLEEVLSLLRVRQKVE